MGVIDFCFFLYYSFAVGKRTGRPKTGQKQLMAFRIAPDTMESLRGYGEKEERSLSWVVNKAVREFLRNAGERGVYGAVDRHFDSLMPDVQSPTRVDFVWAPLLETMIAPIFCKLNPQKSLEIANRYALRIIWHEEAYNDQFRRVLSMGRKTPAGKNPPYAVALMNVASIASIVLAHEASTRPVERELEFAEPRRLSPEPRRTAPVDTEQPVSWRRLVLVAWRAHYLFVRAEFAQSALDTLYVQFARSRRSGQSLYAYLKGKKEFRTLGNIMRSLSVGYQKESDWETAINALRADCPELPADESAALPLRAKTFESHDSGLDAFLAGQIDAFGGGIVQTDLLLDKYKDQAVLFAGPRDFDNLLDLTSLNTLVGTPNLFEPGNRVADGIEALWDAAITWFEREVLPNEKLLHAYIAEMYPGLPETLLPEVLLLNRLISEHVDLNTSTNAEASDFADFVRYAKQTTGRATERRSAVQSN